MRAWGSLVVVSLVLVQLGSGLPKTTTLRMHRPSLRIPTLLRTPRPETHPIAELLRRVRARPRDIGAGNHPNPQEEACTIAHFMQIRVVLREESYQGQRCASEDGVPASLDHGVFGAR